MKIHDLADALYELTLLSGNCTITSLSSSEGLLVALGLYGDVYIYSLSKKEWTKCV